jgi:hypothetical protein
MSTPIHFSAAARVCVRWSFARPFTRHLLRALVDDSCVRHGEELNKVALLQSEKSAFLAVREQLQAENLLEISL